MKIDVYNHRLHSTKSIASQNVWSYVPTHSEDFVCLPACDLSLSETDQRIGDYIVLRTIAEGHFSKVKECRRVAGEVCIPEAGAAAGPTDRKGYHMKYAIKVIMKEEVYNVAALLRIEQELNSLSTLGSHKNIVKYYGCLHASKGLYMVTELMPGDLFAFIEEYQSTLNENIIAVVLGHILDGMLHMASHSIVHRDLKPENVLVNVTGRELVVKLCDFGLSKRVSKEESLIKEFSGSPGFFAPESLISKAFCPYKADIFSFGAIALEMLTSHTFFNNKWMAAYKVIYSDNAPDFSRAIRVAIEEGVGEIRRKYNVAISDFAQNILNINPSIRSTLEKLRGCRWIGMSNGPAAKDTLLGLMPTRKQLTELSTHLPVVAPKISAPVLKDEAGMNEALRSILGEEEGECQEGGEDDSPETADDAAGVLPEVKARPAHERPVTPLLKGSVSADPLPTAASKGKLAQLGKVMPKSKYNLRKALSGLA